MENKRTMSFIVFVYIANKQFIYYIKWKNVHYFMMNSLKVHNKSSWLWMRDHSCIEMFIMYHTWFFTYNVVVQLFQA